MILRFRSVEKEKRHGPQGAEERFMAKWTAAAEKVRARLRHAAEVICPTGGGKDQAKDRKPKASVFVLVCSP